MGKVPNLARPCPHMPGPHPPRGAGTTLSLCTRQKQHAALAWRQHPTAEGLAGPLSLPRRAFLQLVLSREDKWGRVPGRAPWISKVRVWNSDGPVGSARLCVTRRSKKTQTGSLFSVSPQKEVGDRSRHPWNGFQGSKTCPHGAGDRQAGTREGGVRLTWEVGKATSRRS